MNCANYDSIRTNSYILHRKMCFEAWSKKNEGDSTAFDKLWKNGKEVYPLQLSCPASSNTSSDTQELVKEFLVRRDSGSQLLLTLTCLPLRKNSPAGTRKKH